MADVTAVGDQAEHGVYPIIRHPFPVNALPGFHRIRDPSRRQVISDLFDHIGAVVSDCAPYRDRSEWYPLGYNQRHFSAVAKPHDVRTLKIQRLN